MPVVGKRPRGPRSAPKRAAPDLKAQAVSCYVNNHLQSLKDAPDLSRTLHDDVIDAWALRPHDLIISLGVSTLALAVHSKTHECPAAAVEAATQYEKLLKVTQDTITRLDEANIEACLLAIFFMSRYEDSMQKPIQMKLRIPFDSAMQSFSHHDGGLAILQYWKDHLSQTQTATSVIRHTRHGMIRSALLRNRLLPDWFSDGTAWGEQDLGLAYDRIIVRIVNIRHLLSTLSRDQTDTSPPSPSPACVAERVEEELVSLDWSLGDWAASLPKSWSRQQHALAGVDVGSIDGSCCETIATPSSGTETTARPSKPAYAALSHQYFSTRMLVSSTQLTALGLCESKSDAASWVEKQSHCQIKLRTMTDQLILSLESYLRASKTTNSASAVSKGNSKTRIAYMAVWPLSIASSIKHVDAKQSSWFRSEMARLGKMLGFGVFEHAETTQWPEL